MVKSGKKITKTPSLSKLTITALFTALIAILAQFAIPVPFSPVPFTGQVIGVLVAGTLLGKRSALLSITAYLLLGAAGAPVFSLGRGGLHMLTGPSGGYLWGFIPAVYIIGLIVEHSRPLSLYKMTASMLLALSFIYLFGALQLSLIMQYSLGQVLAVGVLPFIPLDLLKVIMAIFLSLQIKKSLHQNKLDHLFMSLG